MVLVLLQAEAFVSMIYNFKQVGRAKGGAVLTHGTEVDSREQKLMQLLPLHTGKSGQHREREGNTSELCH